MDGTVDIPIDVDGDDVPDVTVSIARSAFSKVVGAICALLLSLYTLCTGGGFR